MSGVTPEFNLFHRLPWPEFHDSLVIKVDITALNVVNNKFPDTSLTISQISFQFPAKMFFLAFVLSNAYYSFCQEISWQVEAMVLTVTENRNSSDQHVFFMYSS